MRKTIAISVLAGALCGSSVGIANDILLNSLAPKKPKKTQTVAIGVRGIDNPESEDNNGLRDWNSLEKVEKLSVSREEQEDFNSNGNIGGNK
ncbi:MAG TPA: hypothetical protein DEE98_08590 [Elusimicrobia bacterium]|nr:MAG: hypothetical protein A2278_05180 [Elusimicrobia bacterium RIFOXYA12_FULL_49_49]OGS07325.1 MAG: hypothetical protein A2204_07210 [Elusimicrobia bacterium RIFOXYA1_FULL_47_7]OGS10207.1 MAG: hypothetical protein A2386_00735 [Elusimicrobia bacterium RIFOXYB1_FULL_48_9]OGS15223.1 MAG: hypothetical protein A2251_06910 [Elusimicrobia bacterium RIFOXYA2_FULL_47_53]OGS25922.1 MAG: hypothetical protein A2339_00895 [Elusimicrobia bacterium RIFOXYB12_FULL_50_12]OGS30274.1 MAG: hypothetical protein